MNQTLSQETIKLLWRIYRESKKYQVRQRAHAIILINQGYEIEQVAKIFTVSRKTIYNWQNSWFNRRLAGLYNQSGTGRKELFDDSQKRQIINWSKQYNQNLGLVIKKAKDKWGIQASKDTIKRILKYRKIKRKAPAIIFSKQQNLTLKKCYLESLIMCN
ncbi:hypothetical protein H1P_2620005 [Hyella patelloides LEGE 07179]|uniref:Uncharacterized protein n=1 Tax=Hyella patelloides LEGE 07179 TaxID=945734 RepID=A0A563VS78_9CYAN|nr:helix-turn-helix domain-containing protein [Hyella patelloides]VEP14314.1 hypothetical protein H1P_2570005 [Hyella patelloides LEGE 07179]VEP14417.1 hypothetical protein H1P_2620005 [Hyella patelloides LEGE 07179]